MINWGQKGDQYLLIIPNLIARSYHHFACTNMAMNLRKYPMFRYTEISYRGHMPSYLRCHDFNGYNFFLLAGFNRSTSRLMTSRYHFHETKRLGQTL